MDWIVLNHDRDQWSAVVSAVMKLLLTCNTGILLVAAYQVTSGERLSYMELLWFLWYIRYLLRQLHRRIEQSLKSPFRFQFSKKQLRRNICFS
jgi:hypothetical protein